MDSFNRTILQIMLRDGVSWQKPFDNEKLLNGIQENSHVFPFNYRNQLHKKLIASLPDASEEE